MKKLLLSLSLIASFSTINAQWVAQNSGFQDGSVGLKEIRIVDANTVWGLGYDGSAAAANIQTCTVTSNGGATWSYSLIEVGNPDLSIVNISPVDSQIAWVCAVDNTNGLGVVYKTVDGGTGWSPQLETGFQTAGESWINGVHFWDANEGIAYGDPVGSGANRKFEIYRTTNGGTSWTAVTGTNLPVALSNEYGYGNSPVVVGNTIWMTTSKGRLFKSTNRGVSWTVSQTPVADFGGYSTPGTRADVIFSDQNNGYLLRAVGTTTPVYTYWTTVDGGVNWNGNLPFAGTRYIINYIPGTTTIVATSAATPVGTSVSSDNGTSWTDLEPTGTFQRGASAYLNGTTGWCAGFSDADPLVTAGVFKLNVNLATQNVAATAKFKVFPNPATSNVTISVADVDSYNLSVTDLSGKIVMTKSLSGMENTLDISTLATGAYFFNLSTDNKKEVVKILKN